MAIHFLVLQHTEWEGPGNFLLSATTKHDVRLTIIKVWREKIPDSLSLFDGLIVLGGGPNVDQEDMFPFLESEKKTIQKSLAEDRPYLGFCLGHQLLADALGAKVGPNFMPSIGFTRGYLTCEGRRHPCFADFPRALPILKWHSQAVLEPIPKNLNLLMTSNECQVEAFSIQERPHIIGLQFDSHAADHSDVANWLRADREWITSFTSREIDPDQILADAEQYQATTNHHFDLFFSNYLQIIR